MLRLKFLIRDVEGGFNGQPGCGLGEEDLPFVGSPLEGRLVEDILIVVEVVPYIMSDGDVGLEAHGAGVKTGLVKVAHNAAAVQIVLADALLAANQGERVNYDGQDEPKEDLVNQYHIHVLENLEEVDWINLAVVLDEQVPHEPSHCFVGGHEHESEAGAQGVAVAQRLLFEVEEHEDAEEVLQQHKREQGKHQFYFGPPHRHH